MKFYFAPMEGVTGHIYRRAFHKHFNHIDRYFAPFIVADQNEGFKTRDRHDILPENNPGMMLIPQILTNNADDFLFTANKIRAFGYDEINLNLGCPSGTVVSKKRGSGFLAYPDELKTFLDDVFSRADFKISIKTRLGVVEPEEFHRLLEIYDDYPMTELIIHPRVQKDMYRNTPRMPLFDQAVQESRQTLCYNGDLFTPSIIKSFEAQYPSVDRVMIGRGLIMNPGLIQGYLTGETTTKAVLKAFHDDVYEGYTDYMSGDTNVLYKMKEFWFYFINVFEHDERSTKKIKKAVRFDAYDEAVQHIFETLPLASWK